jgi:hypothetical protein
MRSPEWSPSEPLPDESSYDSYISERLLGSGQQLLRFIIAMEGDTSDLELVASCAIVSAHWLMSEEWLGTEGTTSLSTALRARFEVGELPDQDLIDWVVAVCGIFIVLTTVPTDQRPRFVETLARATNLTGVLEQEAAQLEQLIATDLIDSFDPRSAELLQRGSELMASCLPEKDMCVIDPIMLAIMVEKANAFFVSSREEAMPGSERPAGDREGAADEPESQSPDHLERATEET